MSSGTEHLIPFGLFVPCTQRKDVSGSEVRLKHVQLWLVSCHDSLLARQLAGLSKEVRLYAGADWLKLIHRSDGGVRSVPSRWQSFKCMAYVTVKGQLVVLASKMISWSSIKLTYWLHHSFSRSHSLTHSRTRSVYLHTRQGVFANLLTHSLIYWLRLLTNLRTVLLNHLIYLTPSLPQTINFSDRKVCKRARRWTICLVCNKSISILCILMQIFAHATDVEGGGGRQRISNKCW